MRKSEKGFTLIEIIAAVILIAIVAIPLGGLFMNSFKFQARSQQSTTVNEIAQVVAERLKDGSLVKEEFKEKLKAEEEAGEDAQGFALELEEYKKQYDITLKFGSKEEGQNIQGSTPDSYDYTITVLADGTIDPVSTVFGSEDVTIVDNVITIDPSDDHPDNGNMQYNFFIDNQTTDSVSFKVHKKTASKVTFYKQNNNIYLSAFPDAELTQAQIEFREFNLAGKTQVTSKGEDLYNVAITVTLKSEPSITTTMNATFTIEKEDTQDSEEN